MTPDVSVVVEWDNTALAGSERAATALARLSDEIAAAGGAVEVLVCHDEPAAPLISPGGRGLPPGWRTVRVPDGRYYALKNHGAAAASGSIVVFLDSDAVPEPGWLAALLEPFTDPAVQAVAGHTSLEADSLWSRAFALWWFFPLRARPAPLEPVTLYFANNVAFRRATLLAHPFPVREGTSRGACVEQAAALGRAGVTIWKTTRAHVAHPAPRGWRHFVLRALAQGRDRLARERGWRATPAGSVATLIWWISRGTVRTIRFHRSVGLSPAGVPAALALCGLYYGLYFAGEMATFARIPAVRRIRV